MEGPVGRHGIKSRCLESLRTTPELSFAVRYLNTLRWDYDTPATTLPPTMATRFIMKTVGNIPEDADKLTDLCKRSGNPPTVEVGEGDLNYWVAASNYR